MNKGYNHSIHEGIHDSFTYKNQFFYVDIHNGKTITWDEGGNEIETDVLYTVGQAYNLIKAEDIDKDKAIEKAKKAWDKFLIETPKSFFKK